MIAGRALVLAAVALVSPAAPSRLQLDLGADAGADTVLLYQGRASATVVVRFADTALKAERFHFTVDPSREGAICRLPVHLERESLDYDIAAATSEQIRGFVRSKSGNGFALVDGACDSIHFFWNHRTKRLQWWRL